MNKMKITFGIISSSKYQIEAYNKLDAYAAISLYLGAMLYHSQFYMSLMIF